GDPLDGCAVVGAAGDRGGLRNEDEPVVPRNSCFALCFAGGVVTQVCCAACDEDLVSPVVEGNGRGAGNVADQGVGRSPNVGTEQGRQDSCESESLHGGDYIPA